MVRVHVFGSLNVDQVAYVEQLPNPGQTIHGKNLIKVAGGKGLNQAVAAARAGATVSLIGSVGTDESGAWLAEIAALEGINIDSLERTPELSTGTAIIEVDKFGENSIVIISGANQSANPKLLRADPGDFVLAQLETPIESVVELFRSAKSAGATTILNPAPAADLPSELVSLTDFLIPNEHEARQIAGMDTDDVRGAEAAASLLQARGLTACVITLGSRGAIMVTADGSTIQPAFKVAPIDSTAAGDAFCGAFAAALARGKSIPNALEFAASAGALATTKIGAVPSIPSEANVLHQIALRDS
ncbi:MAG TPA: ribokinase [Candidatus Nanopelagicaceae bacterium]|nr:ribokinase [Candidatus Nanopelagicaceae bacterium]